VIDEELKAILVCPACKGNLIFEETRIHLSGLPQGLPDPRRNSGDADQRGATLGPRRIGAGAATQAVILAGGQGARLRPLTLARAKPVVPLLNRPFLAYQLALLREHGVTTSSSRAPIASTTCARRSAKPSTWRAPALRDRVRAARYGGGIRNAVDLARGAVWVLNGDVLTDADLSAMRAYHEAHGSRTTILLRAVAEPRQYGLVETEADGRLRRFREKPGPDEPIATNTINAGVYLIDAALLARIPPRQVVSVEREVFPALIAEGVACYGFTTEAYWRDIGSPVAYRAAQVDLLAGQVKTPLAPPGELRDGCWIEPSAVRGDRRAAGGPRRHRRRGGRAGGRPRRTVDRPRRAHTHRGGRARRRRRALERVEVGEGSVLRDCVVGADVRIGADVEIAPGVVLESGAVVPDHTRLAAVPR